MSIKLILAIILIVLIVLIIVLSKCLSKANRKIKDITAENEKKQIVIEHLFSYLSELNVIQKDKEETLIKIEECKTDEEVLSIISDIISSNNSRV